VRWICLALLVASSCTYDIVPRPGEERTVCKKDGTCDPGLECWSDRCVRPPAADCRAVGERLASVRLGNYAPREQREPTIAELTALCEKEHVSKKEGRCLLEAATEDALAACPRPILPELAGDKEGCTRATEHALELLRRDTPKNAEMAMMLGIAGKVTDVVVGQCVSHRWSPIAVRCLTDATAIDAFDGCIDALDQDDRRALDDAMESLVDEMRRASASGSRGGSGSDPWQ
jgi:hypothetical protein